LLHLYQSNRVEKLMALLAGVVAVPLAAPLAPETIVVQGKGMERWLTLRLAERLTICANVEFPLPATFVWRLMRAVLGDLPHSSAFSPEILTWRIMAWLAQPDKLVAATRLRGYLEGGGDFRRFELACRIADIFDQYLVYRPDWVAAWERGEMCGLGADEGWQAALWRDLAHGEAHWARLMGSLLARLDGEGCGGVLPERVILFGISTLSPLYLELVRKLARHTEVCLFVLNPSREYWELIRDRREQARLAGSADADELLLETGNPLLASLGKQGRDFCGALADFPELQDVFDQDDECDAEPTLLHALQSDILNLIDPEAPGFVPHHIPPDDRSLQIHDCHGAMREVEVLHDQLLHLFAADPSLTPDGVAVLATDIERYAPYIDAVFAARSGAPVIPYGIAGRGASGEQALVAAFLSLLDLPSSRFAADWVLGLLELPALLRRFDLDEGDLPAIHRWVRETGIRWGRDAAHKAGLGLPATQRHTWRDGLSRLMLGVALPQAVAGDGLPLFGATLPYDDVEGERAQVAGRFAEFAETLFELAEMLQGALPLAQWVVRLNFLIERLFAPQDDEESAVRKVRDRLAALHELAVSAQFTQPVGIAVVKSWLSGQLKEMTGGATLSGGVTFASLAPLRSLPFPVICLLGMNDGDFPRRQTPVGFDLIAKHSRPGDRSRRLDDRYLFLETMLSARKTLYISFVGQGIRDNSALPPSVLVADLLDTVRASCGAEVAQRILVKHALQPFSPVYFLNDPARPGYSTAWLAAARALQGSEDRDQRTEDRGQGSEDRGQKTEDRGQESEEDGGICPLFSCPLDVPEEEWKTLELDQLASFCANPARYLMRRRLNIWLGEGDAEFAVREPFGLDYFARDDVRALSLQIRLHGRPPDDALLLAEAQGWLPHGAFGGALHAREDAVAEQLAGQLLPQLPQSVLDPLRLDFMAGELRLVGWLDKVSAEGLIEYTLHGVRPRELYALWLRHLVLCHLKPPGVALHSRLIGADKTVHFAEVAQPERELAKLLDYYWQGLRFPLPFFVKSSHAYAVERLAGKDSQVALKAAHKIWDEPAFRNGDFRGESENIYYRTVYRGQTGDPLDARFEEIALELLTPLIAVLSAE